MTAKAGPAVPANHTDVQQTRYSRTPDGAFPYLDRSKNTQGDGDTVLVAIVFVILLIVLMLTYFALFIYQRIRFPQHGPEDNFELVRRESRNQYPDSVNQVITKDELFSKGGLMDVGYDACRTEAVHAATKFEQDRIQTKRDILSDVQSVVFSLSRQNFLHGRVDLTPRLIHFNPTRRDFTTDCMMIPKKQTRALDLIMTFRLEKRPMKLKMDPKKSAYHPRGEEGFD